MNPFKILKHLLPLLLAAPFTPVLAEELPTPASPPAPQAAPASPQAQPWSDQALLARVLSHNPTLLAAQEAVEAARAEQKAMESELWPQLAFNSQFTAGTTDRMSMPVPGIEPSNMSMRPRGLSANLTLTAMYPLFTGGKLQAQIEGARRRVQQMEADYAMRHLELRTEALTALLNRRWQRAQAEVLGAEIKRQQEDVRLAEERLALGKDPRYVVLRSKSERARLQQEHNLVLLELHQQTIELRRIAALPADTPLSEPLALTRPRHLFALPTPDEAQRLAAESSPQLISLQAQLSEAETRVQIAQANYLPFIYLVGVYEQRLPEMPEMNYTSGGAIDLLIALPVFDGFRRDAEVARFQREASRLLNEYTDVRNRLQADTAKLLLELETLRANLELSHAALEQMAEEYRIVRLRYAGGKSILLEVLDTANQLRTARLKQLENWFQHESARLRFAQLLALDAPDQASEDASGTIRR